MTNQRPQRLLLTLSQPWFSKACESCSELEKITLNNGVGAICRLIEQGKPCKKKIGENGMAADALRESIGLAFAKQDELNRVMMLSVIDNELVKGLGSIEDLHEARQLLSDVGLEVGDTKVADLRKLYNEKLRMKLPDIQIVIIDRLLKAI